MADALFPFVALDRPLLKTHCSSTPAALRMTASRIKRVCLKHLQRTVKRSGYIPISTRPLERTFSPTQSSSGHSPVLRLARGRRSAASSSRSSPPNKRRAHGGENLKYSVEGNRTSQLWPKRPHTMQTASLDGLMDNRICGVPHAQSSKTGKRCQSPTPVATESSTRLPHMDKPLVVACCGYVYKRLFVLFGFKCYS